MNTSSKILVAGIFLLTFALYSSMDIYFAFAPSLVHQFHTRERLLKVSFLIGPAVAMILSHPLGFWFKRFSYRVLYPFTVLLFGLGCWLSSHSELFGNFIYGRVVQGFSLTALAILNPSLLAAMLDGQLENQNDTLRMVLQYYSGVFTLTFLASPLLGSFINAHLGFKWCFYIPLVLSLLSLGIILSVLPKGLGNTINSRPSAKSTLAGSFFNVNLLDRNLFLAAFPPCVSFLFSIHAPFYLARLNNPSSHAIAVIQILPLLCQLLASSLKRSFGNWPLLAVILTLSYASVAPLFLRPFLVIFAFCLFPFFSVPLMAKATAKYLQTKSKIEASANLNFYRNLFISTSTVVSTFTL